MQIRKATYNDIPRMMEIFADARAIMRESGNLHQWNDSYPSVEAVQSDISGGVSYIAEDEGIIIGTFAFIQGPDPTYSIVYDGQWPDDDPYYVIHRIAASADKTFRSNKGFAKQVLDWAFGHTDNIRIDTHRDNVIMHHILTKYGFTHCGRILLANGDPREAYSLRKIDGTAIA